VSEARLHYLAVFPRFNSSFSWIYNELSGRRDGQWINGRVIRRDVIPGHGVRRTRTESVINWLRVTVTQSSLRYPAAEILINRASQASKGGKSEVSKLPASFVVSVSGRARDDRF
jgi:hypothetical protein